MDIKDLLQQELRAATLAADDKKRLDAEREALARTQFQPIAIALQQLREELTEHGDIHIYVTDHFVTVKLGEDVELSSHLYGWSKNLSVDCKRIFRYPDFEVTKRSYSFEDAPAVIAFLVKSCAEYLASKKNDGGNET